ncbi:hypothetical protein HYALB_00011254 [Hymenoscyphus albidus]|uniref:Uncharacterized protein n=1 Tax=Hymenoscyphus albidus TaxID=595503 RepID=A0A9N9LR66_9HELO|nr:hypothetical protein HYALB_00011254 [Hymenoscyphus albidus]
MEQVLADAVGRSFTYEDMDRVLRRPTLQDNRASREPAPTTLATGNITPGGSVVPTTTESILAPTTPASIPTTATIPTASIPTATQPPAIQPPAVQPPAVQPVG